MILFTRKTFRKSLKVNTKNTQNGDKKKQREKININIYICKYKNSHKWGDEEISI